MSKPSGQVDVRIRAAILLCLIGANFAVLATMITDKEAQWIKEVLAVAGPALLVVGALHAVYRLIRPSIEPRLHPTFLKAVRIMGFASLWMPWASLMLFFGNPPETGPNPIEIAIYLWLAVSAVAIPGILAVMFWPSPSHVEPDKQGSDNA